MSCFFLRHSVQLSLGIQYYLVTLQHRKGDVQQNDRLFVDVEALAALLA